LRLDLAGAFSPITSLQPSDLTNLAPQFATQRAAWLTDLASEALLRQPARLLAEYKQLRKRSELGRILLAAHRWLYVVDRIVVLGASELHAAALAMKGACCEPYYDDLTRGERGGRPRLIFKSHLLDNDSTQALLALLGGGRAACSLEDRWGLVVLDTPATSRELTQVYPLYVEALKQSLGVKAAQLPQFILPVTYSGSKIERASRELGCEELFYLSPELDPSTAAMHVTSLLPAALLGIDIPRILLGAAHLAEHFSTAPAEENLVFQLAGMSYLVDQQTNMLGTRLGSATQGLAGLVRWHEEAVMGLGTRPPWQWCCLVQLVLEQWRHDSLGLPELLAAENQRHFQTLREAGQPSIALHVPRCDEATLGQLMQLLMLTDWLETRWNLAESTTGQSIP
jgi:glucose-6-phosphate isomerase